jgi:NADH-quinone oxidoreductase subunit N
LLVVAVFGVIISIYYYFGWIKAAFFPTTSAPLAEGVPVAPAASRVGVLAGTAMIVLTVASLVLGVYQGPLGQWFLSQ